MSFSPTDLQAMLATAEGIKSVTQSVLSSQNKQEAKTHEDACSDMNLQLSSAIHYYDELIEQKRRDLADTRQEKARYVLLKKELNEHGRRARNHFFELLRSEPK